MNCKHCVIYDTLSKIDDVEECDRICTCCDLLELYREKAYTGTIDPSIDVARFNRFNTKKHYGKRKRRVKNASNNKSSIKGTIPKSRKKFKNQSK